MITRTEELVLAVVRFLRRCWIDGDTEALKSAGIRDDDQHLLRDLEYWRKTHRAEPAAAIQITMNWHKIRILAMPHPGRKPQIPASAVNNRNAELTLAVADYFQRCLREGDYRALAAGGVSYSDIELLEKFPQPATNRFSELPIQLLVQVDYDKVDRIAKRQTRMQSELEIAMRLIKCRATFPMLQNLTGMNTHEFAGLRTILGVEDRHRLPARSIEEAEELQDLINRACPDGQPPDTQEYLVMCDMTNDKIDLGKAAAEVKIRWPDI